MKFTVFIEGWGASIMEGESEEKLRAELKAKFPNLDVQVTSRRDHSLSDTERQALDEE